MKSTYSLPDVRDEPLLPPLPPSSPACMTNFREIWQTRQNGKKVEEKTPKHCHNPLQLKWAPENICEINGQNRTAFEELL